MISQKEAYLDNLLSIIIPVGNRQNLILRALESIPKRIDISIIIIDDNSSDNSIDVINEGRNKNLNNFRDIHIIINDTNIGVGASKHKAYNIATSKYIYVLDSDDYILTDKFNELLNSIDKYSSYDIIRIDNEINDGSIEHDCHTSGGSYILKNRFNIEYPKVRKAEDGLYGLELKKKNAKIISTGLVCYHYNYPHEGSLVGNYKHGLINGKGEKV